MAKKIKDDLYEAYEKWILQEKKSTKLHQAFEVLAHKHLGNDDRLEQGGLVVELARMRMEKNGESAIGSHPDSESGSVKVRTLPPQKKVKNDKENK